MKKYVLLIFIILLMIATIALSCWSVWFNFYEVKAMADYPMWYWEACFAIFVCYLILKLWDD